MASARWIRLDVGWSSSDWIGELRPPSRLAWIELLCYVKSHGVAGTVPLPSTAILSRLWDISRNAIDEMISGGMADGAIVFDGRDCLITGWGDRQMDKKAAERMRAYRERQKALSDEKEADKGGLGDVLLRPLRALRPRARPPDTDSDSDIDTTTSSPKSPPSSPAAREDDEEIERELKANQPTAKLNIVAIHGGTEEPVQIEGHDVGVGIEIEAYKRLCREGRDPPEIIAAAIAHIPSVSELEPPVSLARWGAEDGRPIYEQCLGRAYKELTP